MLSDSQIELQELSTDKRPSSKGNNPSDADHFSRPQILETRIGLYASTGDHAQTDRRTLADFPGLIQNGGNFRFGDKPSANYRID
jgi:hypothetical protein